MKYLCLSLFAFLFLSCGSTKDVIVAEETDQNPNWTFENIASIILEEFPEAYENFLNISFSQVDKRITPEKASFLIPTRFFEKKLTQEVCKERTDNVLEKMTGYREGCHEVEIGESKEYA